MDAADGWIPGHISGIVRGDIQCAGITNELLTFLSNIRQYALASKRKLRKPKLRPKSRTRHTHKVRAVERYENCQRGLSFA